MEYTPEDDEFLVRYLAYFHPVSLMDPNGSRSSRKTYELMVGVPMSELTSTGDEIREVPYGQAALASVLARALQEEQDYLGTAG